MVYNIGIRMGTLSWEHYGCNHFIFDANDVILYHSCRDMRVGVSYAMSLHKTGPWNNHFYFIISFTVKTDYFKPDDVGNSILILS